MNTLIFQATVEGAATRQDKTVKVILGTQEMAPEAYGTLFGLNQKFVTVFIKEGEKIDEKDLQEIANTKFDEFDKRKGKSPSHRLRNVFYILWEQDKEGHEEFNDYYMQKMEKVITHYKEMIETKEL